MTSPLPTLAVTGSTGGLGGRAARGLSARGVSQRLLVRNLARAPHLDGAVPLPFTFSDREATLEALRGVETLLMVSAHEGPDRPDEHQRFVESARDAGVDHIVYTSFIGASADCTFTLGRDHFHTEHAIRESGMRFTFLRDSFYLDFMPNLVGDDGAIRGPADDGRVAVVAREDVARAAIAVLRDPHPHAGRTYDLTGPEALTLTEVAERLSAVGDSTVTFLNETVAEAYVSRSIWGAPDWQIDAWVSTYAAIANGDLERVSGDVERLTGRRPVALSEFLAE